MCMLGWPAPHPGEEGGHHQEAGPREGQGTQATGHKQNIYR